MGPLPTPRTHSDRPAGRKVWTPEAPQPNLMGQDTQGRWPEGEGSRRDSQVPRRLYAYRASPNERAVRG